MAKEEAATRLAKLTKLLPLARELHDKLGAVLEEMDAIAGGGAGIASQVKTFETAFDGAWCGRYAAGQHGRYMWRKTVDVPNIKRLIKGLGLDELLGRMTRYIASEDPFLIRARHPFGLLVSGINSYAAQATAPEDFALDAPTVPDCKHTPRCTSDQQHTDRKMRELRA